MIRFYDCDFCKHSKGTKNGYFICDAFPEGVPYSHMDKDLKKAKECNNGIGYEPREENKK